MKNKIFFLLIALVLIAFIAYVMVFYLGSSKLSSSSEQKPLSEKTVSQEEGTRVVKLFFSNKSKDPKMLQCAKVYPVERALKEEEIAQKGIIRMTLEALLKGPTEEEKNQGFITSLNPETKIRNVKLANKKAEVDFSKELSEGAGGSCLVSAIRAQIEETLKALPEVKEVVLYIEGQNADEVLQP